jgi:membrane associated rhomboid family serine protease
VAWWAHIGGFIAGMVLIIPMKYRQVKLFDQAVEEQ